MSARLPHLPAESWDRFLRDELSAEAGGRIEAHLADCAECRAALEREDPSFLFRRLRDASAPETAFDGFWDAISTGIQEAPDLRSSASPHLARLSKFGGMSAAAAIAAAVIGLAIFVVDRRPDRDREGGQVHEGLLPAPDSRAEAISVAAEPCPAALAASLKLTRAECAALHDGPIASPDPPEVMVSNSLDLRGL